MLADNRVPHKKGEKGRVNSNRSHNVKHLFRFVLIIFRISSVKSGKLFKLYDEMWPSVRCEKKKNLPACSRNSGIATLFGK